MCEFHDSNGNGAEIFGEQTNSYILVDEATTLQFWDMVTGTPLRALYLQVLLVCY